MVKNGVKVALSVVVALLLAGCVYTPKMVEKLPKKAPDKSTTAVEYSFSSPKKSAHYEGNTPAHGQILAGVPINVVINFNFDLAKPSRIEIVKDKVEYGEEETVIDASKLAMRRRMKSNAGDGVYTVKYKACWPDGSCHDGQFQFAIDRDLASGFVDYTSRSLVSIDLKEIAFVPENIKIKSGTKVTWKNTDGEIHYINSDAHPHHTYLLDMNSKALKKNETYSYTFTKVGIYLYHCSVHPEMTGYILVE